LKPITLSETPLAKKLDRKNKIDHRAAPKYWAEVEYRDIATDGLLRHVTFLGLYVRQAKANLWRKITRRCAQDGVCHRRPSAVILRSSFLPY